MVPIWDQVVGSGVHLNKDALRVAALAAAVGLGFAAGYLLWGVPKDWYAGHDPARLPKSPDNELIQYGWELVVDTSRHIGRSAADPAMRYAGNDLACTNCHLDAALKPFAMPFVSTYATYPMMVSDVVETLAERLDNCMMRSLNGRPLPREGREMQALVAYIRFVGEGTPEGVRVPGMGLMPLPPAKETPDAERGERVFAATCTRCHGADGQGALKEPPGVGYSVPPLWGSDSFNAGAGMAKIETAAAFIHANMPRGINYQSPILTEQQAWDVAAFVTSRPRPPAPEAADK